VEEILDVSALFKKSDKEQISAPVLEMDLGNLLVFDYQEQKKGFDISVHTQRCVQEMFGQVFNLPVTASDAGPLARLPEPTSKIPREKPPPQQKVATKWEEFAKSKGIVKRKKSRMVWDDIAKEYRPRWGKDRPLDPKQDWVLPHNPEKLEAAGVEDPFELNTKNKKEKLDKQKTREMKNKRRASQAFEKGTPVTLELQNKTKREKHTLERAVTIAQKATASMGKYDEAARDEPKIKHKPRLLPGNVAKEKEISSKIVDNVLRHQDKMDVEKAANQEITREQKTKKRRKA